MGLMLCPTAIHRGTDKLLAGETTYTALAALPDLQIPPIASIPLRDVLNAPLQKAYLDAVRINLLKVLGVMNTPWNNLAHIVYVLGLITGTYSDKNYSDNERDVAARAIIRLGLDSFFGSYLKSKLDLTGDANTEIYYGTEYRTCALMFHALFPSLDLNQVLDELVSYAATDGALEELMGRGLSEEHFPVTSDLNARLSLCCGAVLMAYHLEGRA